MRNAQSFNGVRSSSSVHIRQYYFKIVRQHIRSSATKLTDFKKKTDEHFGVAACVRGTLSDAAVLTQSMVASVPTQGSVAIGIMVGYVAGGVFVQNLGAIAPACDYSK